MSRTVLLALLFATSAAHANVWEAAIANGSPERAAQDKYDSEMRQGDEHALQANMRNASLKEIRSQLQLAVMSYKAAAAARPNAPEPWYRIGTLLYSFYFDCNDQLSRSMAALTCDITGKTFNRERAREVIAAWNAFESRAPLDPRLSVGALGDNEILFDRAILHTKLATKADLEAAASDYEKLLARQSGDGVSERVLGNLAETYMMLGRMDDALDTYREALRSAMDTSTWYGYAVALDRDESSAQALEIIRSLGHQQRDTFRMQVELGSTFFVPEGEKYYYFALSDEAFGLEDEAIDNWAKYIASGAHPEFQPRAKAHLDALSARKKRRALPIESPWPQLFR
jgi:tetratricopeptide (TPR) repeat protein